jgi:hypothetical protein
MAEKIYFLIFRAIYPGILSIVGLVKIEAVIEQRQYIGLRLIARCSYPNVVMSTKPMKTISSLIMIAIVCFAGQGKCTE